MKKLTTKPDRFTLEQEIMSAWAMKDNLDLIYEVAGELKDPEEADHLQNLLLGVVTLYERRMNKLLKTFELLIKENDL